MQGTKQFENEPLPELYEDVEVNNDPPEPTLSRRAKSYSDFYHVVRAQLSRDAAAAKKKHRRHKDRTAEALVLSQPDKSVPKSEPPRFRTTGDELLEASQHEYLLYAQQLEVTERHLDSLIGAADGALGLLTSLSESFRAVELQTTTFQSQCDDLISEEKRLQVLADEVGTDLHYYAYLDGVTRRLNAPGASRLVDHENFGEVLTNLDACINFMTAHVSGPILFLTHSSVLTWLAANLSRCGFISGKISSTADQGFALGRGWIDKPSQPSLWGNRQANHLDNF